MGKIRAVAYHRIDYATIALKDTQPPTVTGKERVREREGDR